MSIAAPALSVAARAPNIATAAPYIPANDSIAVEVFLNGTRKAHLKEKFGWGSGLPELPREGVRAGKTGSSGRASRACVDGGV
jgi:hypothetical protein